MSSSLEIIAPSASSVDNPSHLSQGKEPATPSSSREQEQQRLIEEIITPNQALFNKLFHEIESALAPDPKIAKSSQNDPTKYIKRQEQLLLEHSDRVIKTAAREILGKSDAISTAQEKIITDETWDDLNLFHGDGTPGSSLVNRINHTSTELGKMYLMGLVGCPTADVKVLRDRQALIQGLMTSGVADAISTPFNSQKVRDGEKQLLSSWDPKTEYPGCILRMFYRYQKQFDQMANGSPLALDAGIAYDHTRKVVKVAAEIATMSLLLFHTANLIVPFAPPAIAAFAEQYAGRLIGTRGVLFAIASWIPSRVTNTATFVAGALGGFRIRSDITWLGVDFALENLLHKKFLGTAAYYRAVKNMYTTISAHPELTQYLSHFQSLKDFFENKELSTLFSVLESHTFDGEAGPFFRRGNVLYLLNQFTLPKIRKQFEPALAAVAEIDAFVSAANLIDEFKDKRVRFCFPKYLEGKQSPELHVQDFWNVFVNPERVVANSVDFSTSPPIRCQLITGPNGGGKTTLLRSLVGNIVLGQSLGIASATSLSMTPFKYVASSMNIADIQGEKSHFQAECDRIVAIKKRMGALGTKQFGYVVLDELFSGTTHEESSALARTEVELLGEKKDVLSMVVTHDEALTHLEGKNSGIKNYQVVVNDQAEPLYKLKKGTSGQHTAFVVAQRRGLGNDSLLHAKELYSASQSEKEHSHPHRRHKS